MLGCLAKPGQGAVELAVIGPVVLHGAAGLVRDGQDAIDAAEIA